MLKRSATTLAAIIGIGGILFGTDSFARDSSVGASSESRARSITPQGSERDQAVGVEISVRYSVHPNIVYSKAGGVEVKLDIYQPRAETPARLFPTLVYMHGGGWMDYASKDMAVPALMPFLQRGWVVINVDYRPSSVALAPAAVEDCLCALRWIGRNGGKYGVDTSRLVLMGHSAGGHLALTTGMIPLSTSGLGAPCVIEDMHDPLADNQYPQPSVKIAAIVNWYGITNLATILDGPDQQAYAVKWLGNQPARANIVKEVSPISYVRAGVPPIITIHGTSDRTVPYSQATEFHRALSRANIPNQLISVPNHGHTGFGMETTKDLYEKVFEFLKVNGAVTDDDG